MSIDDAARLTYLVARCERAIRGVLDEIVHAHSLTTPAYVTLSVLRRRPGLSSAQLARRAFVTPQAMNLIITDLESRELIARRPSADNKRVLQARLTARGRRLLGSCERDVDRLESTLTGGLSAAALRTMRSALEACTDNIEQHRRRESPPTA